MEFSLSIRYKLEITRCLLNKIITHRPDSLPIALSFWWKSATKRVGRISFFIRTLHWLCNKIASRQSYHVLLVQRKKKKKKK